MLLPRLNTKSQLYNSAVLVTKVAVIVTRKYYTCAQERLFIFKYRERDSIYEHRVKARNKR
jgi:hypothetical protein